MIFLVVWGSFRISISVALFQKKILLAQFLVDLLPCYHVAVEHQAGVHFYSQDVDVLQRSDGVPPEPQLSA